MKKWTIALAIGAMPMILLAFSQGPNPGVSGVPGESGTCANASCHVGTPVGTSMVITADGGATYQPGVAKTITVTITDARTRYGFQATARLASDTKSQAGAITTGDTNLLVLCSSLDLTDEQTKPVAGCPSARPLEYVSHRNPRPSGTFTFTLTPKADASGNIIIYAAGNAANGNSSVSGDRIHTATLTLTPGAAPSRPSISPGGVITVANFGASQTIAPQSFIEIYGTNLAASIAEWSSSFVGGVAPTSLNGVEVTIGGQPAFINFTSPGQVNVQVPDGVGTGMTALTLKNAQGTSDNYMVNVAPVTPALLAPPTAPFKTATRQFIAAFFPDSNANGPFAGNPSESPQFRSAKPNDRLIIYALGMGPVTPPQQAGRIVTGPTALGSISMNFGGTPVALEYAGLAPNFVGLYQINAVVPNLAPGEYAIGGMVNGTPIPAGLFINLK